MPAPENVKLYIFSFSFTLLLPNWLLISIRIYSGIARFPCDSMAFLLLIRLTKVVKRSRIRRISVMQGSRWRLTVWVIMESDPHPFSNANIFVQYAYDTNKIITMDTCPQICTWSAIRTLNSPLLTVNLTFTLCSEETPTHIFFHISVSNVQISTKIAVNIPNEM